LKLYVIAFALLLSLAGTSHAEGLEGPRGGGKSGTTLHEWMPAAPPPPDEGTGDALWMLRPAPMELQLLSGPSILPLGLLLLGLGAGRLFAREG